MKRLSLIKKEKQIKTLELNTALKNLKLSRSAYDRLIEMYKLRSYTGYEDPMRQHIMTTLNELNIPYVLYNGNIIGLNHNKAPLLSSHMDMVNTNYYIQNPNSQLTLTEKIDTNYNIRMYNFKDQTSLGADDKNGIWIILELLREGKDINFIFSHGEEGGCVGINQVISNSVIAKDIENKTTYCLVLDRSNSGDIIGYDNDYCVALDDKLESFAKENKFKYTTAHGLCSDANSLSKLIECVNLSVGYYQAHTSTEFTNLKELLNAKDFVNLILKNFKYETVSPERMRKFKKCSVPYTREEIKIDNKLHRTTCGSTSTEIYKGV